jgi:thiamine biosynthesis lipoprotein
MQTVDSAIPVAYKRVLKLMGNRFEITVVTSGEDDANECIDAAVGEIRRIEKLLTTFDDSSQTCEINRNAGIRPVKTDPEVFELIRRSLKISELTQGAFDITYGSIDKKFWNFDTTMTELPDPETAKQTVRLINYRNVLLDKEAGTVFLKEEGMRIGFGGIGKGYAADRAKQILLQRGNRKRRGKCFRRFNGLGPAARRQALDHWHCRSLYKANRIFIPRHQQHGRGHFRQL